MLLLSLTHGLYFFFSQAHWKYVNVHTRCLHNSKDWRLLYVENDVDAFISIFSHIQVVEKYIADIIQANPNSRDLYCMYLQGSTDGKLNNM